MLSAATANNNRCLNLTNTGPALASQVGIMLSLNDLPYVL